VALRHLEHELTSGAVIAGKCEPVDAPDKWPTVGEIEQLTGDLSLISVGTSPNGRGYGDTVLVRLQATDTLARYYIKRGPTSWERRTNGQIPLTGKIIDRATGRPKKGVQAYLFMSGPRAELTLTDAPMVFDGWVEAYAIRRVNGKEFFGGWLSASGFNETKGYFCAGPAPTH
jgi:hypothetical protein